MASILFLHPNFPGQFKQLAIAVGNSEQADAKFICMTDYGNNMQGIQKLIIKGDRGQGQMLTECRSEIASMGFRAESYRRAFKSLKNNGWNPDVVIGHSGWGCGMHVKEIWPDCKFIAYMEWWFHPKSAIFETSSQNKFLEFSPKTQEKLWHRNKYISCELSTADKIIAPSHWQKQQLPEILRSGCEVIYDGVDINYFQNKAAMPNKTPLVTYGTRGMEPMRCFKEFIKCLPHLMKTDLDVEVEIAGEDKICYGGHQPGKNDTWGEWAKRYVADAGLTNRVRFLGRLSYASYREWLQRSWCHVYLTHPFVCSWSLLEAMACDIRIVASDSPPVTEFCRATEGIELVDNNNLLEIVEAIRKTLHASSQRLGSKPHPLRWDALGHLSLDASLTQWNRVTGLDLNTRD